MSLAPFPLFSPPQLTPTSCLRPFTRPQNFLQLVRLVWSTGIYIATRPLWLVLGVLGYLVLLGGLLITVWLGVYTWVGKLAFHAYWVVRGWLQVRRGAVEGGVGGDGRWRADRRGAGASDGRPGAVVVLGRGGSSGAHWGAAGV